MPNFDPNNVISQTKLGSPFVVEHEEDIDYKNLLWLIQSPNLFDLVSTSPALVSLRSFVAPHDFDSIELKQGFDSSQRRLGLYAEDLLSHYFSMETSPYSLLARNLQIFGQGSERKKTQGEFDFILMSFEEKRYYHLELACKFYLGVQPKEVSTKKESSVCSKTMVDSTVKGRLVSMATGQPKANPSELNHWVGPGCNDRLDIKVNRMLDHQLLLSQSVEGEQRLTNLAVSPVDLRYLLKGIFFYPAYSKLEHLTDAGSEHLKGLWWSVDECEQAIKDISDAFGSWRFTQIYNIEYMVPRRQNLYENPSLGQDQFLDYVSRHFAQSPQTRFSQQDKNVSGIDSKLKLTSRPLSLCIEPVDNHERNIYLKVFVVPSCWEGIAQEYTEHQA